MEVHIHCRRLEKVIMVKYLNSSEIIFPGTFYIFFLLVSQAKQRSNQLLIEIDNLQSIICGLEKMWL